MLEHPDGVGLLDHAHAQQPDLILQLLKLAALDDDLPRLRRLAPGRLHGGALAVWLLERRDLGLQDARGPDAPVGRPGPDFGLAGEAAFRARADEFRCHGRSLRRVEDCRK